MRYLAAIDTVHTAAAACDYLTGRLDDGDDVVAITVRPPDAQGGDVERDGREALNVLGVRLPAVDLECETPRGEPAETILDVAATRGVDEIVIGARGGAPGAATGGLGSTARNVLADAAVPVVVLPVVVE